MQKKENDNFPDVEKQGWDPQEIASEASQAEPDEIMRQMLRGDETKGNADERDVAGSVDSNETAHGRKETKHDIGSTA